jgi:hypothetical protein
MIRPFLFGLRADTEQLGRPPLMAPNAMIRDNRRKS